MQSKTPLSVVLAVFNEEKNLARCLEAIKDFTSEIVIVDGGSTDQTLSIAQKYHARVVSTTNKLNFHLNKQKAISLAKHRLILQLDADEVVDASLRKFIQKLLAQGCSNKLGGWQIRRKNYFLGNWLKKGGQYPDTVTRLFFKDCAYLPGVSVHEQIVIKKGELAMASGHLLHYSNPDLATYWHKAQTYTSFSAQNLLKRDVKNSFSLFLTLCLIKPVATFFSIFIRHKGFVDGWRGLLFASLSSWHHPWTYYKFIHKNVKS